MISGIVMWWCGSRPRQSLRPPKPSTTLVTDRFERPCTCSKPSLRPPSASRRPTEQTPPDTQVRLRGGQLEPATLPLPFPPVPRSDLPRLDLRRLALPCRPLPSIFPPLACSLAAGTRRNRLLTHTRRTFQSARDIIHDVAPLLFAHAIGDGCDIIIGFKTFERKEQALCHTGACRRFVWYGRRSSSMSFIHLILQPRALWPGETAPSRK